MWYAFLEGKKKEIVQIKQILALKNMAIHRGYRNVLICKLVVKI